MGPFLEFRERAGFYRRGQLVRVRIYSIWTMVARGPGARFGDVDALHQRDHERQQFRFSEYARALVHTWANTKLWGILPRQHGRSASVPIPTGTVQRQ